jgi:uncharacterized protein
MRVLLESDYISLPWKNGGGITREILKSPPQGATFDWRLSLAAIDQSGPFSAFDGYNRVLVLVRGPGVELSFGPNGQTTLRAPGQLAEFDGGWPTQCTLLDGSSVDLNLMVSQTRAQAQTEVLRIHAQELIRTSGWDETLVCCISGQVQLENDAGEIATLGSVDVARCNPDDGVMTCATQGAEPALLFVAYVKRLQRGAGAVHPTASR